MASTPAKRCRPLACPRRVAVLTKDRCPLAALIPRGGFLFIFDSVTVCSPFSASTISFSATSPSFALSPPSQLRRSRRKGRHSHTESSRLLADNGSPPAALFPPSRQCGFSYISTEAVAHRFLHALLFYNMNKVCPLPFKSAVPIETRRTHPSTKVASTPAKRSRPPERPRRVAF